MLEREVNVVSQLLFTLNRCKLQENSLDKWRWRLNGEGRYNTKSAYEKIVQLKWSSENLEDRNQFCNEEIYRLVWNAIVPLKVSVMAWRLIWDRLPTKVNLIKRRIPIPPDEVKCYSCEFIEESANHLFLHCPLPYEIWTACYRWLGVQTVCHGNIRDHFLMHFGLLKGKRGKKLAICIWECVVWLIWKAINNYIFRGLESFSERILDEVKSRVWSWCLVKKIFLVMLLCMSGYCLLGRSFRNLLL